MYDVVLLIEQELSALDADQVLALHEELEADDERVTYHVLLPVEESSTRVHAALGSIARYEMIPPTETMSPEALARLDAELVAAAQAGLQRSLTLLRAGGHQAEGELIHDDPVGGLVRVSNDHDAAEAIVVTGPHAVREFLHVDWTSRARRALGIPILHLLEHETFDEQGGGGEGVSGV